MKKKSQLHRDLETIIKSINKNNTITDDTLNELIGLSNKNPQCIYLLNQIGIAYYKIFFLPQEALLYFKRALLINSNDSIANFCLGSVYAELDDYEKAQLYYRKVDLSHDSPLLDHGSFDGVGQYYYFPFASHDESGLKYPINVSLEEFFRALDYLSDVGDLYRLIAECYEDAGDEKSRIEILEKGASENPKSLHLYQEVISHHYYNGNHDKVLEIGERFLATYEKEKGNVDGNIFWDNVLIQIGDSYKNIREYDRAITTYKKVKKYCEDKTWYVDPYKHVGDLYYKLFKDYDNALEAYQKSIEYSKNSTYQELGPVGPDGFCEVISFKGSRACPEVEVDCYRSIGWIFIDKKQYIEAAEAFSNALDIKQDPNIVKEVQLAIKEMREVDSHKVIKMKENYESQNDARSQFRKLEPHKICQILEIRLREHIEVNLSKISTNWWDAYIPKGVKKVCHERIIAEQKRIKRDPDLKGKKFRQIDYTDLGHLKDIIISKKCWKPVYKNIFSEPILIEDKFQKLIPLRNQISHHRELDENQKNILKVFAREIILKLDKSIEAE